LPWQAFSVIPHLSLVVEDGRVTPSGLAASVAAALVVVEAGSVDLAEEVLAAAVPAEAGDGAAP
jgi:hypothetical protein